MTELKYCPKCGQTTLQWNGINNWNCASCDYVYYHNCAAAVAVLIRYQNELFFTKRNQDPKKGLLDLAGGFVDPKESAEETCARELHEELQISIDLNRLKILGTQPNIYHYKGFDYNTVDIFFEYEVAEKMSMKLALDEISETVWISIQDLDFDQLAFESQKTFLKKYQSKFS